MKQKILTIIAITFVITMLFSACQKEDPEGVTIIEATPIDCKEGVLIFKTAEDFTNHIKPEKALPEEGLKFWEETIGFYSQKRIQNDIMESENKFFEPYLNMSEEELSKVEYPTTHSNLYNSYLQKGLIKEYTDEDGTYYLPSLCMPNYSNAVNEDGFFMIADTLFQVTDKEFKFTYPADLSKRTLLKNATKTNENIFVFDINQKIITKGTGNWSVEDANSTNKNILQISWGNQSTNNVNARFLYLNANISTLKKPAGTPFWFSGRGELHLFATFTINYVSANGYTQQYSDTHSTYNAQYIDTWYYLGAPGVAYNNTTHYANAPYLTQSYITNINVMGVGPGRSGGMYLRWSAGTLN